MPSWRCTQNLKTLAPIGAEKSVTEISIGEKEKWTNKGTDKKYEVVCLLHNTTHHSQALYQTQVVAEKSLTEKKFTDRQTDRQTNIITEKAKTIYPYILRTGGIN